MQTARARYRTVLHAPTGLPCARAMFLPETAAAVDYAVNLRVDCPAT